MTPQATPITWSQLDEINASHYAAREVPSVITRAEAALNAAQERLDKAVDVYEACYHTDGPDWRRDEMLDAAEAVALAADELDTLRAQYAADPVAFWRDEDYQDERETRLDVLAGMH